jgi:hypothetical protein
MADMNIDEILEELEETGEVNNRSAESSLLPIKAGHDSSSNSPQSRKRINQLIQKEQRYRLKLATKTLPLTERIKAWYTNYFTNKNTQYPEMSHMVDTKLQQMMGEVHELDGIIQDIQRNGEQLFNYYNDVADSSIEDEEIVRSSSSNRTKYSGMIDALKDGMDKEDDYIRRTQLRKGFVKASVKYRHETSDWIRHNLLRDQRDEQMSYLEGALEFTSVVQTAAEISMDNAKLLGESLDRVKFIYDILPNTLRRELGIEQHIHEVKDMTGGYNEIIAGLLVEKKHKLEQNSRYGAYTARLKRSGN